MKKAITRFLDTDEGMYTIFAVLGAAFSLIFIL